MGCTETGSFYPLLVNRRQRQKMYDPTFIPSPSKPCTVYMLHWCCDKKDQANNQLPPHTGNDTTTKYYFVVLQSTLKSCCVSRTAMTYAGVKAAEINAHELLLLLLLACDNDGRARDADTVYLWANRSGGTSMTEREKLNKRLWRAPAVRRTVSQPDHLTLMAALSTLSSAILKFPTTLRPSFTRSLWPVSSNMTVHFGQFCVGNFLFRGWYVDSTIEWEER